MLVYSNTVTRFASAVLWAFGDERHGCGCNGTANSHEKSDDCIDMGTEAREFCSSQCLCHSRALARNQAETQVNLALFRPVARTPDNLENDFRRALRHLIARCRN